MVESSRNNLSIAVLVIHLFPGLALVEGFTVEVALPGEVLGDHLLVGFTVQVQLLPVVGVIIGLPVGAQVEGEVLSFPEPNTADFDVALLFAAEHAHVGEAVLSHLLDSLVESADQVARHEWHGDLIAVLVLTKPATVVFLVQMLPEVVHGSWDGVVVGVASLPGVKVVVAWWAVPWVLGLLGCLGISDSVVGTFLYLLGCLLFLLWLLLLLVGLLVVAAGLLVQLAEHFTVELSLLGAQRVRTKSGHLVNASLEPSSDVWDGLSALWSQHLLEGKRESGHASAVGDRRSLARQESLAGQRVVERRQSGEEELLGLGDGALVVWHSAEGWEDPGGGRWGEHVLGETDPLEVGGRGAAGHMGQDGAELGQVLAAAGGEDWRAGMCWEAGWRGAWHKVGAFEVSAGDGGGSLHGSRVRVAGPCEQGSGHVSV